MTLRPLAALAAHDRLNFVLTNLLPRHAAGQLVGRVSRSENPLVRAAALWAWQCFTPIDLADAERRDFRSMHDCFTRRLKPGARPLDTDPSVLASPCDAIIGASGPVAAGRALQVKGMDYPLADLLGNAAEAAALEGASYVTLRLTSAMYHRFHAPADLRVDAVRHIWGDRWNVNPPTLRRVARLFCRNERVVLHTRLAPSDQPLTLVAVAAILVSGIRLGFLPLAPVGRAAIRRDYPCDAVLAKGGEMGWFEHGSTIIAIAPPGCTPALGVHEGARIRMGQALLQLYRPPAPASVALR